MTIETTVSAGTPAQAAPLPNNFTGVSTGERLDAPSPVETPARAVEPSTPLPATTVPKQIAKPEIPADALRARLERARGIEGAS
jgi:hypothetical protein